MGQAVGTVLPLAVAIAIFPVPVIAAVLLAGSERGVANSLVFVLAWIAGLAAVGAIVLVFAGAADASEDGEPATWVSVLLLALGLVLLAAAVKQWLGRPRTGAEARTPSWMRSIDAFTPMKTAGAGLALTALNPKNVLLVVAAAAEIAEFGLPAGQQIAALAVFVIVASLGVATPIVLALALGDRSRATLDCVREWMTRYNAVIMAVLCLVIGAKLVGDALSGFWS